MTRIRHHQAGYVFKKGSNWYVRYRETVQLEGGSVQRIQKCRKLAEATGQYRTKRAAEQLAEEILRPLNDGVIRPESTMSLNHFIEISYLPYVADQKGGPRIADTRTFGCGTCSRMVLSHCATSEPWKASRC